MIFRSTQYFQGRQILCKCSVLWLNQKKVNTLTIKNPTESIRGDSAQSKKLCSSSMGWTKRLPCGLSNLSPQAPSNRTFRVLQYIYGLQLGRSWMLAPMPLSSLGCAWSQWKCLGAKPNKKTRFLNVCRDVPPNAVPLKNARTHTTTTFRPSLSRRTTSSYW